MNMLNVVIALYTASKEKEEGQTDESRTNDT